MRVLCFWSKSRQPLDHFADIPKWANMQKTLALRSWNTLPLAAWHCAVKIHCPWQHPRPGLSYNSILYNVIYIIYNYITLHIYMWDIYIYIYIHIYTHIYTYIYIYIYIYIYWYGHIYIIYTLHISSIHNIWTIISSLEVLPFQAFAKADVT